MTVFVGIDPGATGGIAALFHDRGAEVYPMPDVPVAVVGVLSSLSVICTGDLVVYSEKAVLMPKNGAKAAFSVGRSAGIIQTACAALGLPLFEVAPAVWRPKMVGRNTDKEVARKLAIQHYPHLADQLKFKNRHGLAEALLIAEWGKVYGSAAH